jgi:orotidine-5'-phosphate decarboxylase
MASLMRLAGAGHRQCPRYRRPRHDEGGARRGCRPGKAHCRHHPDEPSDDDIWAAGFETAKDRKATRGFAELARQAGLDGVVCSPHDVTGIRHAAGKDFLTVVPGIRPADAATQDQKRVATPAAAIAAGADILVIGRAITAAADPAKAARDILASLKDG